MADFKKAMTATYGQIAHAATSAIKEAADLAKAQGRANIASAGFSLKWQNALHAKVYPENGESVNAAALIYHKIQYAGIFEHGGPISGKPFLWLPLDTVPMGDGGRRMTPAQFTKNIGVLYSINRPGKPPMLGAVIRATDARASKAISLSQLRRGRNPKGFGTVRLVPVFIGVPAVNIPKKFDIIATVKRVAQQLPELYSRNLKTG